MAEARKAGNEAKREKEKWTERRVGEGEVGKEEGERRAAMTGLEGEVHRKGLVSVIHRVHHEVE